MKLFWNGIMALLIIVAIPMFIWGTMSQNLETRRFAQSNVSPVPTKSISRSDDLIIYSGSTSNPTPEPTMEAPLPTPTIISSQNNSKLFQLGQILLISVITIAVGLILRQIMGGSD